ncbi:MAG TPA: DUF3551 domain-containing protein [Xanthobacteraceae bacterium]|jgi:hypothetical protein
MRTIVVVATALGALSLTSIQALADGAWCAYYTKGATNCGFHSYAQCAADVSGIGGSCAPNPGFQAYNSGYQGSIQYLRRRAR